MTSAPIPGGGIYTEVTTHIDYVQSLAQRTVNDTTEYIEELNNLLDTILTIPDVSSVEPIIFEDVSGFNPPDKPEVPTVEEALPSLPTFPILDPISDINLSTKPEFTDEAPGVDSVSVPSELSAVPPTEPDVETDFTYPTEPTTTIPSVPTLESLSLPNIPTINIETWSEDLPDGSNLIPPTVVFNWNETAYSSTLLTDVTSRLVSQLAGGTGLATDVEQAIWDRARNREDAVYNRTKNQLLIENAGRGFTLPTGSLSAKLQEAAQEVQNKIGSLSRDVAIKQAELEQENLKIAVGNTLNLEKINMDYTNQLTNRLFESQKYIQEVILDVYKAKVNKFQVELETYKAYSVGFETRLKAALTDLEVYKGKLEGQKLVSEINDQSIKVYLGQLQGVKTESEIYKTNMDAISVRLAAEGLKVTNFKALVDAYSSQVQAKVSEYQLFDSRLKAAMAPLDVYKTKVDAYASRIKAYGTEVDAEKTVIDAEIQQNTLSLDSYKTQLSGVLGKIEAISKQYENESTVYRSAASMYTADVGAEGERYRSETAYNKALVDTASINANIQIQNSQLQIKRAMDQIATATEIIKAQSAMSSQLAAAALSALDIGAQISSSSDQNWNYGFALDHTNL